MNNFWNQEQEEEYENIEMMNEPIDEDYEPTQEYACLRSKIFKLIPYPPPFHDCILAVPGGFAALSGRICQELKLTVPVCRCPPPDKHRHTGTRAPSHRRAHWPVPNLGLWGLRELARRMLNPFSIQFSLAWDFFLEQLLLPIKLRAEVRYPAKPDFSFQPS